MTIMKLFSILTLLILLVSCAPAPSKEKLVSEPVIGPEEKPKPKVQIKPPTKPDEELAEKLAKEQEEKIKEEISKIPKFEPRDRVTAIEQFWMMYAQNITSYQFRYPGKGAYFVRGDKAKLLPDDAIILSSYTDEEGKVWRQARLDAIYLDLNEKTAVGYCEGIYEEEINKVCAKKELYDKPFKVNYSDYKIELPHEWMLAYQDKAPVREEQDKYYIKGRQTTMLAFSDGVQFFIDPRNGLPVRVVVGSLNKHDFEDLVVNQVRDVDVKHRKKSEIPQEEFFYKPKY